MLVSDFDPCLVVAWKYECAMLGGKLANLLDRGIPTLDVPGIRRANRRWAVGFVRVHLVVGQEYQGGVVELDQ